MKLPDEITRFERLVQRLNPQYKLLRAWELKGGVSAEVTALEIEQPDLQKKKMVVRRHSAVDLRQNPHIAADEFTLLQILKSAGIPAPESYDFDESGTIFPTPYLVIEFIEGQTDFSPSDVTSYIHQLAANLAQVHQIDRLDLDLSFLPKQEELLSAKLAKRPEVLDESLNEGRIRDTLETVWPLPQSNENVLLHGDFWPGNAMWTENQQLAAIIDWEDAATGDPLADFANGRMEILFVFGVDAMNDFTQQYESLMPAIDYTNLPYWDLAAALKASTFPGWGLDESTEKRMRERHQWFVMNILDVLSCL